VEGLAPQETAARRAKRRTGARSGQRGHCSLHSTMVPRRTMPAGFQIRAAHEGDADRIVAIHTRSWQSAYRGILPDDFLDALSFPQRQERLHEILATSDSPRRVWVVESGDTLLGFAEAGPSREDDAPDLAAEVYTIYLDPTSVGKGIGRELFAHTVADLRNAAYRYATLWVLERNARARRFYEKAGWRADGTSSRWERFNINALRYRIDF
jgi:ribosomal protein S18 acetylase RimI-like enzyme